MTQSVLEKRSSEAIFYDFDCSADLLTAETVASITSITADVAGLTFGAGAVNSGVVSWPDGKTAAIGEVIQVLISSGRNGARYKIRAKYVTNLDNVREATVLLLVHD